jgi:hypothetical protein
MGCRASASGCRENEQDNINTHARTRIRHSRPHAQTMKSKLEHARAPQDTAGHTRSSSLLPNRRVALAYEEHKRGLAWTCLMVVRDDQHHRHQHYHPRGLPHSELGYRKNKALAWGVRGRGMGGLPRLDTGVKVDQQDHTSTRAYPRVARGLWLVRHARRCSLCREAANTLQSQMRT